MTNSDFQRESTFSIGCSSAQLCRAALKRRSRPRGGARADESYQTDLGIEEPCLPNDLTVPHLLSQKLQPTLRLNSINVYTNSPIIH